MKTVTLTCCKHEEFGTVGLRWKSWMDPFDGMGTAHDVLEHFPKDSGSTEEELMALGASILVRNFGEYFANKGRRNTNPGYQMSADIVEQINYKLERGESMFLRDPGKTTKCEEIDEYIETAIQEARREAMDRKDDDDQLVAFLSEEEEHKIYGWIRRGYRKAMRRYKEYSNSHVCWVFQQIEEAVDRFLKHAEPMGQKVKLSYDLKDGRVFVEEEYDFED